MPKFSVYVPDALWKRAKSELGNLNMSQLVQKALQERLSPQSPAGGLVTQRPTPDPSRIDQIKARYAEAAEAVFADGYEVGMRIAERISADELIRLHDWEFALADYEIKATAEPWKHTLPGVMAVVESVADEQWGTSWPTTLHPGSIAAQGAVTALRDVWSHLFREETDTVETTDTNTESPTPWEHLGVAGYLDPETTARLDAAGATVEQFWEIGITGPWTPELITAVLDAGGPEHVRNVIYGAVANAISPDELEAMLNAGIPAIYAATGNGPFDSAKDLLARLR